MNKSPISQFAKLISLKTIELNRVSIFFHEIFRINIELPDDLKFWSEAFKKFGRQKWAWLPRGHLESGAPSTLKSLVTCLTLLVNCYLQIKFYKKINVNPPPPLTQTSGNAMLNSLLQLIIMCTETESTETGN